MLCTDTLCTMQAVRRQRMSACGMFFADADTIKIKRNMGG